MKSKISVIPSVSSYQLEVDGKEISLIKNKMMFIPSKDLLSTFSVFWSSDSSIILETPEVRVTLYNGKDAKVEDKNLLADGSQCGLCGDYNRNLVAEIKSPKGCVDCLKNNKSLSTLKKSSVSSTRLRRLLYLLCIGPSSRIMLSRNTQSSTKRTSSVCLKNQWSNASQEASLRL